MANYRNNPRNQNLPRIDLGYTINGNNAVVLNDSELLNTTARTWAEAINRTKRTQARNFYDKVLVLQKDIKTKGFDAVYPFIQMLNSKVAYAVNRRVVSPEFQKMMQQCLEQIKKNDKDEQTDKQRGEQIFNNFQLFFEAVLGYFKGSN